MPDDLNRAQPQGTSVILYDGVCGLCNRAVRFVLKRDHVGVFRFASLQSSVARDILAGHGIKPDASDTFYVVLDLGQPLERVLSKSTAALYVASMLGMLWRAVTVLKILPRRFRDAVYDTIARHRYQVFGRYDSCPLPETRYRERFIETE